MARSNSIELTVEQLWLLTQKLHLGTLPWVLAITPPYMYEAMPTDALERLERELTALGALHDGQVVAPLKEWLSALHEHGKFLELRYVRNFDMMRGLVVWTKKKSLIFLRNAQFITVTELNLSQITAVVELLITPFEIKFEAQFSPFSFSSAVGAQADAQIRGGKDPEESLAAVGLGAQDIEIMREVMQPPRFYVEIIAGEKILGAQDENVENKTSVAMNIIQTEVGLICVSSEKDHKGQWITTYAPGSRFTISDAIVTLTKELSAPWFQQQIATREF